MLISKADVDRILSALPHLHRGPGGAAAVLKDGKLISSRVWGYADIDRGIPMTVKTQFPICSISKQMVCLAMLSLSRDPTATMRQRKESPKTQFQLELQKLLPHLAGRADVELTIENLCNMQSGIRDYWAMTTLYGARPDGRFSLLHDAPKSIELCKQFHFSPGTEYSYSNVNFYVLGRILENVAGQSLAQLLVERVFIPAEMRTASLNPNTNGLPLPIVGYEGDEKLGFFRATNRIEWAGDAGIAASLEDMIAYEKYVDRSTNDPQSLYYTAMQSVTFSDGKPAAYGTGLVRRNVAEKETIGHGAGLRGFRHYRVYVPSERLSVVVMMNHETDPTAATDHVLKEILQWKEPEYPVYEPARNWFGDFLDAETQLYITVEKGKESGTLSIRYARDAEFVRLTSDTRAECRTMTAEIDGDVLHITRISENRILRATRIPKPSDLDIYTLKSEDYTGSYYCEEAESTFHCTGGNGTLYASFTGFLGDGPKWLMRYIGGDVIAMGNPRGLDASPPGDWTMVFKRDGNEKVIGCTVGCWLSRNLKFVRSA